MAYTTRRTTTTLAGGLRTFAEASIVVTLGVAAAVLLIGTPIALLVHALHEALSWLTRSVNVTGPFAEAVVAGASSVGGVVLFALLVRFAATRSWSRGSRIASSRAGSSMMKA